VRRLCLALFATLASCAGEPPPAPPTPPHKVERPLGERVFPMDWAPALDDARRDEWQRPDEVLKALRIEPGARVADVGCGTGYFALRLLRVAGHVIAVDIQQGMLDLLSKRLGPEERKRVTLRRSEPEEPLLPGDRCDLVLCANTLHEVDDAQQARFMKSMAAGLAPDGRLAIINWKTEPMRLGPRPEHRLARGRIEELAAGAGLVLAEAFDFLPMHDFLVFERMG